MATRRPTFTKTQRERDKRAKAAAKRERRLSAQPEEPVENTIVADEHRVIEELALLHERYESGAVPLDEFLARRQELLARLVIS